MLKQIFATTAIAATAAGFLAFSLTAALAEVEPPAAAQELKPSPGKVVLQQYSYAPCGNDWFTRCEIRATADGAYYDIYHGFMRTELVESEKLSEQDWATIKNIVLPAARSAKPEVHRGGFRMGTAISLSEDHAAISLPEKVEDAYQQTKPGQRYLYWSGPGRVTRE